MSEIDLTKQPPCSPRLTLNGLVGLPRLIEKARAAKFGQLGSYKSGSDSSLDKEILEFVGLPTENFLSLVEKDQTPAELVKRLSAMAPQKPASEVIAWSQVRYSRLLKDDPFRQHYAAQVLASSGLPPASTTTLEWLEFDDRRSFNLERKIAVVGSGNVGGSLGQRLSRLGDRVGFGVRVLGSDKSRSLQEAVGSCATVDAVPAVVRQADIVVLATPWTETEAALRSAGDLSGKIVIDCTNPIGYSQERGLFLDRGFDNSGGEEVHRWATGASVVKAFNTYGWENFADSFYPNEADVRPVMFFCGDDDSAKGTVAKLIEGLGFAPFDVGKIKAARYLEPLAMLWIENARKEGRTARFVWGMLAERSGA
jgi:8-hydroxy-5-deazaflavin:NADPH oxidoreductase